MAQVAHYANAFSTDPGRCFRYVDKPGCQGQPMRCPEPVSWRGRFRGGKQSWRVDSCEEHAGDLGARVPRMVTGEAAP